MSVKACFDEIRKTAGENLSDREITALMEDILRRRDRGRAGGAALSEGELLRKVAQELGAEASAVAAIEKRNAALNYARRVERRAFYEQAPAVGNTPGILVGLEAKLVGVNTPFKGSHKSVDAQYKALHRDYLAGMTLELDKLGLFEAVRSGAFDYRRASVWGSQERPRSRYRRNHLFQDGARFLRLRNRPSEGWRDCRP